ncbi:DUF192 domain-containing protein [Patescibacteria group bacterium]|nr:DUF192 domain-containing protein [Patescibacteria group bacterium]
MKKAKIIIIFLSFVVLGLWLWSFQQGRVEIDLDGRILEIGEAKVSVEIADSPEEWSQGLSGREGLGEDDGMLFVFPNSTQRSFWMKGMRFPLDMLFIDQGSVVEIVPSVPAPSEGQDGTEIRVVSQEAAEWVLEVNSGWVEGHGIVVGDGVELL